MITIEFVQNLSTKSFVRCNSSALFVYVSVFYTVHFGYIIHWIYHPAAYIGHFRPEPNFSIIKPPDISSSPSVISATLRVARGNCLPVSFAPNHWIWHRFHISYSSKAIRTFSCESASSFGFAPPPLRCPASQEHLRLEPHIMSKLMLKFGCFDNKNWEKWVSPCIENVWFGCFHKTVGM